MVRSDPLKSENDLFFNRLNDLDFSSLQYTNEMIIYVDFLSQTLLFLQSLYLRSHCTDFAGFLIESALSHDN
jgi:hypothetical protein